MEKAVSYQGLSGMLGLQEKFSATTLASDAILLVPGFCGDKDESHGLFKDAARYFHKNGFSTAQMHLILGGVGHSFRREDDLTMRRRVYEETALFFKKQSRIYRNRQSQSANKTKIIKDRQ